MTRPIFVIKGGGQYVRQQYESGQTVFYELIEADWPEKAKCTGQNHYTTIWSTDFESLQKWADEWAGAPVKLHTRTVNLPV